MDLPKPDPTVQTMLGIVEKCSRGRRRKFSGEPEINHFRRVARQVASRGPWFEAVALGHDLLEDKLIARKALEANGIPSNVVDLIEALSRGEHENYFKYIMRLRADGRPIVFAVKVADLTDNLTSWPKEGSMKDKWRLAYFLLTGEDPPC